jgi:hypothetical protein
VTLRPRAGNLAALFGHHLLPLAHRAQSPDHQGLRLCAGGAGTCRLETAVENSNLRALVGILRMFRFEAKTDGTTTNFLKYQGYSAIPGSAGLFSEVLQNCSRYAQALPIGVAYLTGGATWRYSVPRKWKAVMSHHCLIVDLIIPDRGSISGAETKHPTLPPAVP